LRKTVNLVPLGKHWGFNSLRAHQENSNEKIEGVERTNAIR